MDLRQHSPRRWNETLGGLIWLARLLDKARAYQAGTLGTYAYPSALDRAFMRLFSLSPAVIEELVRAERSDEAVANAILRHIDLSKEDIAARCRHFSHAHRLAFRVLDADEGYRTGIGYPIPRIIQAPLWRWYQRWSAQKASATSL
ncbi:MAG TPA: DUF5069 domain-containing protein [Nitrospiraceae bacterium]|nr:DUF5069 domain-containing protein [Nitrospiraceae bacterium]